MDSIIKLALLIIAPLLIGLMLPDYQGSDAESFNGEAGHLFNPDHLDGPFTGGFGELTCHSCHFDYDLNMTDRGSLTLKGLSKSSGYQPGKSYELKVTIQSDRLEIGGFQMTARFEDGTQAGSFEWQSGRLMYTPDIDSDVQYVQHTREGTFPTSDRSVAWSFNWIAPEYGDTPVHIHIAANAGNDDDSAFGDWIYTMELILQPERIGE